MYSGFDAMNDARNLETPQSRQGGRVTAKGLFSYTPARSPSRLWVTLQTDRGLGRLYRIIYGRDSTLY